MTRKTRGKSSSAASDVSEANIDTEIAIKLQKNRKRPEDSENVCAARKMPKRAAACCDFREKPFHLSGKSSVVETKRGIIVEDEIAALHMTSVQDGPRPNRRLTNFIFHDSDGKPQPVEMLEVDDLFISGLILPLEGSSDKDKERGIRCEGFGRIESWAISGYEEGSPVIWVSTDAADYDCVKPANNYKKPFSLFFEKARACIEVYKKLSRAFGGNPDQSIDELLAGVARSMSGNKNFPHQISIKDFIASQGEFIYNQLIGLDETSMKNDEIFRDLLVLVALRDEVKKYEGLKPVKGTTSGNVMDKSLRIGNGEQVNHSSSSSCLPQEDEDMKLARMLQEEENWQSKLKKNRGPVAPSNKFYIKINEDEIANDYPLPAYYTSSHEETDEFLIFDLDTDDPDHLPKSMLDNWTLYNSDSRLISLELLPMKPCADIDVTVFGSGLMMEDDGSGFNIDANTNQSASGSADMKSAGGMPIYLSAIKEWTIEYGHGMIFIFLRTDLAWYRLGKPSKQYAPWYKPVLKAARLTVSLITLLDEEIRLSRISFANIVRKISEFDKDHPAFISSNLAAVERYLVVHGPIILQQLSEYPGPIKNCAFVTALRNKMEERHHTKWLVKKKAQLKTEVNLNPRAAMTPSVSKRKAMPATTTRLINSIWGEFYSNYSPEDTKEADCPDVKENDDVEDEQEGEDDSEEVDEEIIEVDEEMEKPQHSLKLTKLLGTGQDLRWNGESVGKTSAGGALYMQAIVCGDRVAVGDTVLVETVDSGKSSIYFVEYMFENSDARKMIHGRLILRGSQTVLGKAGNEREVFLTNDCLEFDLDDIKQTVVMETKLIPWGYQHRKASALKDKMDRERHEERKRKGLPTEFFCKSLYCPERGAFFCLPNDTMGLGTGLCHCCKMKESQREKEMFKLNLPGFSFNGIEYHIQDFVYLAPCHFGTNGREHETFKSGRNVRLSAYVVGQLMDIEVPTGSRLASPESTKVKVRRFFRPDDVSAEKAYCSDIREVYYSDQISTAPVVAIEGKCDVRKKHELPLADVPAIVEHVFYCEHLYDPDTGAVRQLPANIKINPSKEKVVHGALSRKKGKCKEGENDIDNKEKESNTFCMDHLATLDIFAGCGGLSEGLQQAGASVTKWAIEYEEPAGEAFKLNHPEAFMFIHNCNVILRAIMESSGEADDCISTPEATELAAKLDESMIKNLPRPGEVDFINGGPPCQGFSGMNRFNQSSWSKVQCEMILSFLSFVDYFRPKFFLLENVRNFVSFNKGQTFRLTLTSLLALGYQVRFGILEAGAYGVAQSRKRAFIWAAAPGENLPEWPEPMHVFASPELKVALPGNTHYAAVRSTVNGAPFRSITVRDTIGDLPVVENGASKATLEYGTKPESWFQRLIRGDSMALTDHISKEMNELNLIRCKRIPRCAGADWRVLPDEKVKLSTGQVVDLIPWCLPNTAQRHNQWKGLFGRLDWKGNFPTSVTDPQPMGKVGMCFHPEQDRIVTVRECARSQGFPDTYKFAGNIQHKHRQIGNAVPPPLAYALGRKLKEAVESKGST
ncbi:DNA (cytosine-5)-methyltransferase 1B-like [Tripterygium wilfordii]|uniref:DNA (cytosine-5)-methyltransferase 1B-like n=1 Tax=Tripterygium wilfordii TaxID=458696 RepID=UPI0018F8569F|nr:DNA (cytosine-5)-methyltransferase 1B-like [Tripterygium wilfordii]XP_038712504.1 DNA (cytosine-5)-methyltransferase 1B-like [Tripterygium wilfordii]